MNPAIAKHLNENFVCIKVDREERPDVDQVYMTALQVFGSGRLADVDVPDRPTAARSSAAPTSRPRPRMASRASRHPQARGRSLARPAGRARQGRRPTRCTRSSAARSLGTRAREGVPSSRNSLPEGTRTTHRAVRPRVRRLRLQPREPPPAQVSRAGQPRLPARSAPPRPCPKKPPGSGLEPLDDGRHDARPDGSRRHSRPARRRVSPLRDEPVPGSSRTSRRCSTTTPSSPRRICSPSS